MGTKMKGIVAVLVIGMFGTSLGQEFGGHALFVRTSAAAGKEATGELVESLRGEIAHSRVQRAAAPASPADVMAQNILEWIQGIYRQGARKIRQQSENAYLPPYSTQRPPEKPRPFQPASTPQQPSTGYSSPSGPNTATGVPFQRPSSLYPQPSTPGFPSSQQPSSVQAPPFSTPKSTYVPPSPPVFGNQPSTSYNPRPNTSPSYTNTGSSAFPPLGTSRGSSTYLPPQSTTPGFASTSTIRPSTTQTPPAPSPQPSSGYPSPSGPSTTYGYPTQRPTSGFASVGTGISVGGSPTGGYSSSGGFSTTYGYPSQRPTTSFPSPTGGGSSTPGFSSPSGFTSYGYPSERPTPSFPTPGGSTNTGSTSVDTGYPTPTPGGPFPPFPTPDDTTGGGGGTTRTPGTTGSGTGAGEGSTGAGEVTGEGTEDDDSKHPPHIHSLDVACSKTMMTIDIEFNRAFDGVIYSKGYFMNPECRYVEQNSGQTKYSFTVSLDSCGTQFINDFEGEAGQAYLENVLVLQVNISTLANDYPATKLKNEPGIQEVWDTVRRVRCLWEGNINKALSVNFSVDMLSQEIVTFSGDTATAKLDIQMGRGPFAPAADGLVKIGETMTLVVSVEGDPAFDLQVRDCLARDESSTNVVQLTDERGCILKPKLFGAFQKTNDTGNTGASIIAYAFFQAFKFPDVMDLFIECNIELCKTDCDACPEQNQQIEPGRRRRSVTYAPSNVTTPVLLSESIRVKRGFKVIMLDDLSTASGQILEHLEETAIEEINRSKNVCMSNGGFYAAFSLMLSTVAVATISAAILYIKLQRVYRTKYVNS